LQNLRPIFSLFIQSVAVYVTWRDDHVHETVAILSRGEMTTCDVC